MSTGQLGINFTQAYWLCSVCHTIVERNAIVGTPMTGTPVSNYWNNERKEIYCSAKCSLECHECQTN